MMNKILSVVKFLLILIFIVFIITITTYSLVMIFGYDSEDSSQWVSFIGSILGGLLTLTGVWMTIKHENKLHEEKRKLEYRPFIYSEDGEIINCKIERDANNVKNVTFGFYIYNKGRSEACSVFVKAKDINITQSNHDENITIARDEKRYIKFNIKLEHFNKNIPFYNNGVTFIVTYNGIFEDELKNEFTKIIRINEDKQKEKLLSM